MVQATMPKFKLTDDRSASKKSIKMDKEYVSENIHNPFQNSATVLHINPCTDGKLCKPQMASASNKNCQKQAQQSKSKTATAKPAIKPKRASTAATARNQRKPRLHIHIKKEDGDFKNELIEYNVEFPNRVAVRMEYLMQTTKVRLNDKEFMDGLYAKLLAEEAFSLARTSEMREAAEQNRVKKLVIDGLMPPPPDMQELYNHPVFRVNKMFKRLDEHNKGIIGAPKVDAKISPVEPYEYDGNAFFKNLHKNGTYWVPSVERIAEEEKMAGKIARAKLRLLEKRKKEAEQEKMMRLVYSFASKDDIDEAEEESSNDEDEDDDESTPEAKERKRKRKISRIRAELIQESEKRAARYKRRRNMLERKERIRRAKAEERQNKRDLVFLEDREKERTRLIEHHRNRMENKGLHNLDKIAATHQSIHANIKSTGLRDSMAAYKIIFAAPPTPPNINETASFRQIRKAFHVSGFHKLGQYRPADNPVIRRYIDVIKTADELFSNGTEVTDLYDREQATANDFMNKLNRMF